MNAFLALGVVGFALVGGLVGGRLLRLARRTHGLPEALIGVALVAYAVICQPLLLAGGAWGESLSAGGRTALSAAVSTTSTLTVGCLLAFAWRVFRPGEAWAAALVALGTAASAASGAWSTVAGAPTAATSLVSAGIYVVGFAWAGLEALRYHALLRRRARLGLSDPEVQNRFLVWGTTLVVAALLSCSTTALSTAGLHVGEDPLSTGLALANTCVNAVGWSLSFLPPAWYRRALRARGEAPASA